MLQDIARAERAENETAYQERLTPNAYTALAPWIDGCGVGTAPELKRPTQPQGEDGEETDIYEGRLLVRETGTSVQAHRIACKHRQAELTGTNVDCPLIQVLPGSSWLPMLDGELSTYVAQPYKASSVNKLGAFQHLCKQLEEQ